jgi:hypothetical protein
MAQRGEKVDDGEVSFADEDFLLNYLTSYPEFRNKKYMAGDRTASVKHEGQLILDL